MVRPAEPYPFGTARTARKGLPVLVAIWKHRMDDHGQRIWPPELQDFVGVVAMYPDDSEDSVVVTIKTRFGEGEYTCMPDPPTREQLTRLHWGGGGLSVRVTA